MGHLDFILDFSITWALCILGMAIFAANSYHFFRWREDLRAAGGSWFGLGLSISLVGDLVAIAMTQPGESWRDFLYIMVRFDRYGDIIGAPLLIGGLIAVLTHDAERPGIRASIYTIIVLLSVVVATLLAFGVGQ